MLPPGRIETKPRASFLSVVFLWAIVTASASIPVDKCPRSLDCAREGRHFCQPGSSHCGPCLTPLEENEDGRCVTEVKRHAHFGKLTPLPELDEAIDLLSAIIAKQQRSEVRQSASSSVSPSEAVPRPRPEGSKQKNPPNSTTIPPITPTEPEGRGGPLAIPYPSRDGLLLIMITVSVILGTVALLVAVVCWIRVQRDLRLAQKVDYPALSGTRPNSSDGTSTGDRKLAQSAQMYHYQHQKQQMLSMEKHKDEPKVPDSGATSDEENEDGDFTVYECPGLAPTGEMEVKNPLFDDHTLHPHGKPK